MSLFFRFLLGLALFSRDGWFGRPQRAPTMALSDLVGLAIVQIATVLATGAVMAGSAALLAMVIKGLA